MRIRSLIVAACLSLGWICAAPLGSAESVLRGEGAAPVVARYGTGVLRAEESGLTPLALMGAEIYKWVDEEGKTHYSDQPPRGVPAEELDIGSQRSHSAREPFSPALGAVGRRGQPRRVLGTLALGFLLVDRASLPTPPIHLTLVVRALSDRSELRFEITDPYPQWRTGPALQHGTTLQDFSIALLPGAYEMEAIEVRASSLSDSRFTLVTAGPRFEVPDGACVYVGEIGCVFLRLPSESPAEARARAGEIAQANETALVLTYLEKGSLILGAASIDAPENSDALKRARAGSCEIRLAQFQDRP